MTFTVASEDLEHSQPLTAIIIFCRPFVPSLCGCGGAYDTFACCLSLKVSSFFFSSLSLSHFDFSLWPPNRNRADTRREWIDFKPFNISHVLTDVPNGENFNEVRMLHSEVSDMDDLDLSTVGQHIGSPRMTMSDATRFTETRDEEAGQGEGEARRRRGLETGRWNTTQGAARVESGALPQRGA